MRRENNSRLQFKYYDCIPNILDLFEKPETKYKSWLNILGFIWYLIKYLLIWYMPLKDRANGQGRGLPQIITFDHRGKGGGGKGR